MSNEMPDDEISKDNLLRRMREGWETFQNYIGTLSEEQLTGPMDAAGWTAKDHLIHLAMWEDGIYALLNGQPRYEAMGVDRTTWEKGDVDETNAVIQKRYRDMPLEEVRQTFRRVHERLMTKIESMGEAELLLPYRHYAPDSDREQPVFWWIVGNTFGHYEEHTPWIAAIVESK
jgi:hypothetical protein